MSFLGSNSLKKLIKEQGLIEPYTESRIKSGSYELSLGEEVFRTDSKKGKKEILTEKEQVIIAPGQFALLLTKETIEIPENNIAFISIKAGIKLKGLINVSGFHVDPGFKGRLTFSVYNAGPATIVLEKSKAYFLIWIAEMNEIVADYDGKHNGQSGIRTEYIEALKSGKLASPNSLSKRIDKVNEHFRYIIFALTIIITIGAGNFIRMNSNVNEFKRGYEAAVYEHTMPQKVRNEIHKYLKDSLSLYNADSIKSHVAETISEK